MGRTRSPRARTLISAVIVVVGLGVTAVPVFALFGPSLNGIVAYAFLEAGPVWALAFCLASSEDDFVRADRSRDQWLRLIPWTFVLALLLIPNSLILISFFRDSRADSGRTLLGMGRDRPTDEAFQDHHWPSPS